MTESGRAVFLSYASQDAEAARRICEALRAAGIEVWFDQNELAGGDAWDAKIRKQIAECALFVPVISAHTQARREGYFRLEWKLAAQRTHMMSESMAFLLPVVIDGTRDAEADVPGEFKTVQWTRLPGGETPPSFCAQVHHLLNGKGAPPPSKPHPQREPARPSARAGHRLAKTLSALGIALAVGALALWGSWRKPAPAARTEVQQLVAKAARLLEEGDEVNRETYALAEELLRKAQALDVADATAWAVHAHLSATMYEFGLDFSAARLEALRAQADRAAKLAPELPAARLAAVEAHYAFNPVSPDLERALRALLEKSPDDWQVARTLARMLMRAGRLEEALPVLDGLLQRMPDDPRLKADYINALIMGDRWAQADQTIRRFMAGRTCARLLAFDVYLKLNWSGDVEGAKAAVRGWPSWFFLEDRGAGHAAMVGLWGRTPELALETLRRFPRDQLRDFYFSGPRAVLTAWAHEQLGQADAAQAEWRLVLQVCDRNLAAAPDDIRSLHWKAWALARLGDTPTAAGLLRTLEERNVPWSGLNQIAGGLAGLALVAGQTDRAFDLLARVKPDPLLFLRSLTQSTLRRNPVFDSVRGDPRFQALLAAAPGPTETKGAVPGPVTTPP